MTRRADESTVRTLDSVLTFWVVLWLVVGVWTGHQLWQLTGLSESTVEAGRSLQAASDALGKLSDVPLIGGVTGPLGEQVGATASETVASGQRAGQSIRGLAVLLGLTVALSPSAPVLLLYLPSRWARHRDVRQLRAALADRPRSPALRAYLAGRAVDRLPIDQLLAISDDPRADLMAGRHEALARAELVRMGLERA